MSYGILVEVCGSVGLLGALNSYNFGSSPICAVWERTGEYTFAFTVIALALDSAGNTVGIGKLSGIDILSEDCDTMLIENTLEVFQDGSKNPFEDDPAYVVPLPTHYGHRMKVDPPD